MSEVESRIVTMKFNNGDFKRGVSSTLGLLGKLKSSFGFKGARQNVADLNSEVGRFDASPMSQSVGGVSKSFLAMSTIAITALANVTNKAIDAGTRIVKSLSLDQVQAGFAEYELKMGSIQTIMAGSGEDLSTVNDYLEQLNTYADRTIYSFADMTTNIGKFTNAGVDLDTSVASIQGIANVAAVSGANANEASRAMYNFAQALSKGYVQLIDWKSIELANMGTVEFKQQLIDAAEAQGTLTKQGEDWVTSNGTLVSATKNFNDSLTDQWLTTEVLNNTLGDYADETTDIGKKAFAAAQDVKTFSQLLDTVKEAIGSGYARSFEILIGDFEEAKALFTDINGVIDKFVGESAEARNELLQGWKDLGGRTDLIEGFKAAFQAIGAVLTTVKDAFRDVFPKKTAEDLANMTKAFRRFAEDLKPNEEFLTRLGNAVRDFFDAIKSLGLVGKFVEILRGLSNVFKTVWDILKTIGSAFREVFPPADMDKIGNALTTVTEAFTDFTRRIRPNADQLEKLKSIFVGVFTAIKGLGQVLGSALNFLKEFFRGVREGLDLNVDLLTWFSNVSVSLTNFISSGDGLKTFSGTADAVQASLERLRATFRRIVSAMEPVIEWFKELGSTVITNVKEAFGNIDWGLVFGGVTAGSFAGIALAIRKFLKDGLNLDFGGGFLEEARELLGGFTGVLQGMQQNLKANALIKIAGAIAILALALLLLSTIDPAKLASAMAGVAGAMATLMTAIGTMSKFMQTDTFTKLPFLAATMIMLSIAILILAFAIKKMAALEWEELGKGLLGVGAGLAVLIAATKPLVANSKGMFTAGLGIIFLSLGLVILAGALKVMGSMDLGELTKGLIGIGGALAVIIAAMQKMPKGLFVTSLGIVVLATALLLLAGAVKVWSMMDLVTIGKGLLAVAAALLVIAGAMHLMPPNMIATAAALALVAVAMTLIAGAVDKFGSMSIGELAKGLISMALALLILGVALTAMSATIAGAFALILAAAAINLLVPALAAMAALSWGDLLKALIGLAGALILIGVAAAIFGLAAPLLIAGGIALLIFGVGLAAVAAAAFLFASALSIAVSAAAKGAGAIETVFNAIVEFIPRAIQAFAEGIVGFVMTIAEAAPDFVKAFGEILKEFLNLLIENIPLLDKTLRKLLDAGIAAARDYIPQFIQLGLDLLSSLLDGLIEKAPKIVSQVADLMIAVLEEMEKKNDEVMEAGADLIISFIEGLASNSIRMTNAAFEAIIDFINGLADGVERYLPEIKKAGRRLASAIIEGLFGGLSAGVSRVVEGARRIAEGAINTIKGIFGIASPSKVTTQFGKYVSEGLAKGIESEERKVAKSANGVGETVLRSLRTSMRNAGDVIDLSMDTSPKITPVLDLTQVTKDAVGISKAIDGQTIRANATVAYASNISNERAEQLQTAADAPASTGDTNFTQIINSTKPLSTIDIYRNTKSQLALAKEDL